MNKINLLILVIVLACFSACTKTYRIGDKGPSGGLIFYDKGEFTDDWRYLEAAPVTLEFSAIWSNQPIEDIDTDTSIGSGKTNTDKLCELLILQGQTETAIQLVKELKTDKFDDWFLPSKDELYLMYQNLHQNGIGEFSDSVYWSSSHDYDHNVWDLSFGSGVQYSDYYMRNIKDKVRPIRAF